MATVSGSSSGSLKVSSGGGGWGESLPTCECLLVFSRQHYPV